MDKRSEIHRLLSEGDIDAALLIWRGIVTTTPSPCELLEYAQLLYTLYLFDELVTVTNRLLLHPDAQPDALLPAARLLFSVGRYSASAAITERVCQQEPNNPDYIAIHASNLERSGEDDAAMLSLIDGLKCKPDHARCVRMMAHIERRQGALTQASDRLKGYLERCSSEDDWRVLYELAAVQDRLAEYTDAMGNLTRAKAELQALAQNHYESWRQTTRRQWDLTQQIDEGRISGWMLPKFHHPELRLCLLAGFPRSGTTLLEQILNASDECIGTDETGILATQFRDPLIFQADSAEGALAELESFDAEELADGRSEYLRCTEEYMGEKLNARILIEKDPLLTADLPLALRLFPQAKILMPLRDPRDVIVSFFFTIVPLSSGSVASISIEESCRYYAEVMRHWLYLREIVPSSRWMESRYEDLLAEPEKQTRALADFLEIEWSPSMLSHHKNSSGRSVSTPTYDDVSKPLYTRSKGRWKHYEKYLQPHLHYIEPYIKAFGYE